MNTSKTTATAELKRTIKAINARLATPPKGEETSADFNVRAKVFNKRPVSPLQWGHSDFKEVWSYFSHLNDSKGCRLVIVAYGLSIMREGMFPF